MTAALFGSIPLPRRVRRALKRYDAHLYLPGPGGVLVQSFQPGNYVESTAVTPASVDGLIGRASDASGNASPINAIQVTQGYKPTERRGLVNLLTYSNDFSNAVWSRTNCAIASGQSDPAGGMTAQRIVESLDASTVNHLIGRASNVATVGAIQTLAAVVAPSGRSVVRLQLGSSAAAFDVSSGSVVSGSGATIAPAGNGYYLCAFSQTVVTNGNTLLFLVNNGQTSYQGDGSSGLKFAGEALFDGALTAKQILDAGGIPLTTSAPASSANGKYYWQFDGQDDRLVIGSVPFQMSDDHCVIAAATCGDASTIRSIFDSRSTTLATPLVANLITGSSGQIAGRWCDDAGTALVVVNAGAVSTGETFVASLRKVGNTKIARKNGVQGGSDTTALGVSSANSATIGATIGTTMQSYFNGSIYLVLAIKGTVSDADLKLFEKWIGSLAGVTL